MFIDDFFKDSYSQAYVKNEGSRTMDNFFRKMGFVKAMFLWMAIFVMLVFNTYAKERGDFKEPTIGTQFGFVKSGCYKMGDNFGGGYSNEKPVHEVCVDDFYMGKYEVTQKEWMAIMGNNPSNFKGCDNCPVDSVSWDDVQEFINKLNQKTGKHYRLPTEAEWEYAARSGGKKEKWAGTNNEEELMDYAWNESNAEEKTHPVGQKKPNGMGIYDMTGNVREWVQDWYDDNYYKNSPKNNPQGPDKGVSGPAPNPCPCKVLRGAAWGNLPRLSRTSSRMINEPSNHKIITGFRLAMS